jgi:hypothetical protein
VEGIWVARTKKEREKKEHIDVERVDYGTLEDFTL